MTTPFFAPFDAFAPHVPGQPAEVGAKVVLPPEEARHAVKVLRREVGDEIAVVDGMGGWYRARLTHVGKQQAVAEVLEVALERGEPACHVTLAVGLLKQSSRFETALEKAVELGASAIVPLLSAHSEARRLKDRRAEGILLAALKQSGRSRVPALAAPTRFAEALATATTEGGFAVLCHERASADAALATLLAEHAGALRAATVFVGPEGGFSDAEVEAARAAGVHVASLGVRRLRTETAAITALSAFVLAGLT